MASLHGRSIGLRRRFAVRTTVTIAVAVLLGLSTAGWSQRQEIGGKRGIDVATMNLYVGSDFSPVTSLDPGDPNFLAKLLNGVATIHARIVASDFEKRAEAVAQQIIAHSPDLVGLQEVSLIRRQSPGDSLLGGTVPATAVELDYLALLLKALTRHGAHYAPVSQVLDTDVELPLPTGPLTLDDLRLTDRDVILVRTDLPPGHLRTSNPKAANFAARIPLPIGVNVLRGWCSIDVQTRGRSFRFVNTHLEDRLPAPLPDIQLLQTLELLGGPLNTSQPLILTGDFNADAYGNYSPAIYSLLTGSLLDAWSVARPHDLGLTWGHDEFLSNPAVAFLYRLDLILYRGKGFDALDAEVSDPVLGPAPPLWPSDHAAVFATLAID
jgi:endonuclease/exonuclease/phosphatase family metal-dependent hydrolase